MNHLSVEGKLPLERCEDILSEVESRIALERRRKFLEFHGRRIRHRVTRRIGRLEHAMFHLAGIRRDGGRKFFGDLFLIILIETEHDLPF